MSGNQNKPSKIIKAADRPNLLDIADEVVMLSWPEFMLHDAVARNYWAGLYESFPEFQFCLMESGSDNVMASGNSIPIKYDGSPEDLPDSGWDWALQKGFDDLNRGKKPNMLCALSITVHPAYRELGHSFETLRAMKSIGRTQNLKGLIAPVRPYLKSRYPLISMEKFIKWRNDDGLPFDAWLRVHARDGGQIIRPCNESMVISGSIDEWEEWAAMKFPESGSYTVNGALAPVEIDIESNRGIYVEPNVWVYHPDE